MKIQGVLRKIPDIIEIDKNIIKINNEVYDLSNLSEYDSNIEQRFFISNNEINGIFYVDFYQYFIFIKDNMKKFLNITWNCMTLEELHILINYLNWPEEKRKEHNKQILEKGA